MGRVGWRRKGYEGGGAEDPVSIFGDGWSQRVSADPSCACGNDGLEENPSAPCLSSIRTIVRLRRASSSLTISLAVFMPVERSVGWVCLMKGRGINGTQVESVGALKCHFTTVVSV